MLTGTRQDRFTKWIAGSLLCVFSLLTLHAHAGQAQEKVLLVNSSMDSIYQDYAELLRSYLEVLSEGRYTTEVTDLKRFDPQTNTEQYRLVITSGVRAAEQLMSREHTTPLLVTFIQSHEYSTGKNESSRCGATHCTFLFLDQPPERQMRFVRILFPEGTRLGMLHLETGDSVLTQYQRHAQRYKLRIVPMQAGSSEEVLDALQESITDIDVLLAHPDTRLINRNTAKGILLKSYYHRVPLLAYSSSFVKAGATAGLYSAPDDLARHAAETALQILNNKISPQHSAFPKYFRVELNTRVSNSLDLNLPSENTIQEMLKNDEAL